MNTQERHFHIHTHTITHTWIQMFASDCIHFITVVSAVFVSV